MMEINVDLQNKINLALKAGRRNITCFIGAGILSGSAVPTFKGANSYWTKQLSYTRAEDIATLDQFLSSPGKVWDWFFKRLQLVQAAEKNEAHIALEKLHKLFPNRFKLISQNFAGLHAKLKIEKDKIYLLHGEINEMRCLDACTNTIYPLPDKLKNRKQSGILTEEELTYLKCENCGKICRPNVLFIGEDYTERYNNVNTISSILKRSDVLIIIGVIGNNRIAQEALDLAKTNSCLILVIDPRSNMLNYKTNWIKGKGEEVLPIILDSFEIDYK